LCWLPGTQSFSLINATGTFKASGWRSDDVQIAQHKLVQERCGPDEEEPVLIRGCEKLVRLRVHFKREKDIQHDQLKDRLRIANGEFMSYHSVTVVPSDIEFLMV
jgi:hypothetical protein